jgi:cob(I)alamin adenosyltransferase
MPSFFTRTGDDGYTGLLGEGRVPKYDLRPEVLGTIDEAMSSLGLARATSCLPENQELILQVQRDLYLLMAEAAATPETAQQFHRIDESKVSWVEEKTRELAQKVQSPQEFILPGDTLAGAALDLARTVVRRAERRIAELLRRGDVSNPELLRYLNRLSSLLFVMELKEYQSGGIGRPSLARGEPE